MNVMIKAIQERRLQKGYNFHDIEHATGIPAKRMHSFEKGNTHLSLEEIERLFEFLNLKRTDLIVTKRRKGKRRPLIFTLLTTILFLSLALFFVFSSIGKEKEHVDVNQPVLQQDNDLPQSTNIDEIIVPPVTDLPATDPTVSKPYVSEPSVTEVTTPEGTRLRFWGNVQYQTEQFPKILDSDKDTTTYEIIPIEQLSHGDSIPNWLSSKDMDHVLLNLATRFVWEDGIKKERDRLNKLGYKNAGIDYSNEVFKPYILESEDGTIGILPFTRTIVEVGHIATRNEVGLAKIYDQAILMNAITEAKKDVDLLVVLIGWGDRDADSRDPKNKELAQEMVAAGADLIVGNHSINGQEIEWIDGVPVFYSLGHSLSDFKINQKNNNYSYVLDIRLIDQKISDLKIHIGRLVNGVLTFDLSEEEKEKFEQKVLPQAQKSINTQ